MLVRICIRSSIRPLIGIHKLIVNAKQSPTTFKMVTCKLAKLAVSSPCAMDVASSSIFLLSVSSRSGPAIDTSWFSYTTTNSTNFFISILWH
jgi:hypothetical protein